MARWGNEGRWISDEERDLIKQKRAEDREYGAYQASLQNTYVKDKNRNTRKIKTYDKL